MYILGINAFHGDASACIFRDGEMLVATEEERIRRIKHWAGFPIEAIKFCLKEAGIGIEEVDHVTISRDPKANFGKKVWYAVRRIRSVGTIADRLKNRSKVTGITASLSEGLGVPESAIRAEIHNIEHHRSHLASAFFVSPFEEAAVLSIDGFGDFSSTMTAIGRGNKLEVLDQVTYPHSAGVFYSAFTQYLGFPNYGDEYKVMGLAPYGEPMYLEKMMEVVKLTGDGLFRLNTKYFSHASKGVSMSWEDGEPKIERLYSKKLEELFGPAREKYGELTQYHRDLAASVQAAYETILFHILNSLHRRTGLKNICIAGGCAQNSVANGKVLANTPFENIYIPSAGHDAGTSMGSALYLYNQILDKERSEAQYSAYTGIRYTVEEIEKILQEKQVAYRKLEEHELYEKVTESLIHGGVIGWYQGRAEFGPRALGNRSIIVDPRRADAKELLNEKIKRRESFRPFAPSILEDHVNDYFDVQDRVPFMEKVYPIRMDKHEQIPAVTHVDGTGRLQTVSSETNPRYYSLIDRFREKTGVPVLLNTSFNENKPIVNTPEEALDCFLRTKMDMLVLENIVIERKDLKHQGI